MLYAETLHSKWIANKFLGVTPGLFVGHRNVAPSNPSILTAAFSIFRGLPLKILRFVTNESI